MSTFDHALRELERIDRNARPNARTATVSRDVLCTAYNALKTCRAVQIACNACDGATRLLLWGAIERELAQDGGIEVAR